MLDVGEISGNGTLKINNASVQIVSAEQISPDKTAYFDGIKIAALNNDLTFNGDREAKYDFTNNAISASGDYGKYAFSADGNKLPYR